MSSKIIKTSMFVLLIVLIISVALALIKVREDKKMRENKAQEGSSSQSEQYVDVNPNEHAPNQIMKTTQLTGTVIGFFDPVNAVDGERILTIQADVIDSEKLKEVDFSKETNQLPMVRKEYDIKADNKTKIDKGTLKDMKPGSLVYIETAETIYSGNKLTATSILVVTEPK